MVGAQKVDMAQAPGPLEKPDDPCWELHLNKKLPFSPRVKLNTDKAVDIVCAKLSFENMFLYKMSKSPFGEKKTDWLS